MKKKFSLVLAVLLLFTMLPFSTSANEISERDLLIAEACAVFPEYADEIRGDGTSLISRSRSGEAPTVVFSETRNSSDSKIINYTQYSDGSGTLSSADFVGTMQNQGSEISGSITYHTVNLYGTVVNHLCYDEFVATGVQFAIYAYTYDRIVSTGNYYIDGTGNVGRVNVRQVENDTYAASILYMTNIQVDNLLQTGDFLLQVRNNQATVSYSLH